MRPPLVTVAGAAIPFPYGGKQRQVQIDLDTAAMQARGLSAQDVANALAAQNLIIPVGTQKIGSLEYTLQLNNAPSVIAELGDLPIKVGQTGATTVYIRDVANVHDGNSPQTNIVHVDGGRSVLMTRAEERRDVDARDRRRHPRRSSSTSSRSCPTTSSCRRSTTSRSSCAPRSQGVAVEGAIAAALTSLMILLFLGSWRSTVIIAVSIPLSILGSIIALAAIGETLNIMTLGGLALAVGILVDDATVTIENINWHLEHGKDVETAIMDGARQIVTPAFVSLLCICIVFVPMFFLTGVARFLFVPMAEAVMFAMALLVHPVAHARADDGEVPAEAACAARRTSRPPRAIRWSASSAASRRASSASAASIAGCSCWRSDADALFVVGVHGRRRAVVRPRAVPRQQLLPVGRRRAGADARARARSARASRRRRRASPTSRTRSGT